jgi:hypothetical protein
MRAKSKATKQFFCGEARSYGSGVSHISLFDAETKEAALFLYIEERGKGYDPLKDGEEVIVFPVTEHSAFVLMDDEKETAEEIVEKYATDTEATPETVEAEATNG